MEFLTQSSRLDPIQDTILIYKKVQVNDLPVI